MCHEKYFELDIFTCLLDPFAAVTDQRKKGKNVSFED